MFIFLSAFRPISLAKNYSLLSHSPLFLHSWSFFPLIIWLYAFRCSDSTSSWKLAFKFFQSLDRRKTNWEKNMNQFRCTTDLHPFNIQNRTDSVCTQFSIELQKFPKEHGIRWCIRCFTENARTRNIPMTMMMLMIIPTNFYQNRKCLVHEESAARIE